jgi:polyisoprenoid-binding protein YceI
MRLLPLSLLCSLAFAGSVSAAPVEFTFDPTHTQVEFTYSHFGFSNITGRFDTLEGSVIYDAENPSASSASAKITIGSLSAGVKKLDDHLLSGDFFDAAQFPVAEFKSTQVEAAGEGKLRMTGDLTIHGVTRPVTFDVTVNKVAEHPMRKVLTAGFDATTTIKRSDFGVGQYAPAVSDEVRIDITVEANAK